MLRKYCIVLYCAALLGLSCGLARAFEMNYGTFAGQDVMYVNVTESNDEPNALFGAPSVASNSNVMDFDPPNFRASAQSGESEIVDGQLNFTIMSNKPTFGIQDLIIKEGGDFTLRGLGAALAEATVGTTVRYTVTHMDGMPLAFPCMGSGRMEFVPVGTGGTAAISGEYALPGDRGTAVLWDGTFTVNMQAFLATCNPMPPGTLVTKLEVVIDNVLTAEAANGGSAEIAKKEFNGLTITVPEPEMFSMMSLVGITLLGIRRRGGW